MREMEIGDSGRYIVAVVRANGESEDSGVGVVVLLELFSEPVCLRFFDGEIAASLFLFFRLRSASVVCTTGEVSRSIASTAIVVGSNWPGRMSRCDFFCFSKKEEIRRKIIFYFGGRILTACYLWVVGTRRRRLADSVMTASIHRRNTLRECRKGEFLSCFSVTICGVRAVTH